MSHIDVDMKVSRLLLKDGFYLTTDQCARIKGIKKVTSNGYEYVFELDDDSHEQWSQLRYH